MARFLKLPPPNAPIEEDDPLAGVVNIFDVSVVFIVGLMIALFSVYRMGGDGERLGTAYRLADGQIVYGPD